jgi:hypothetical protein
VRGVALALAMAVPAVAQPVATPSAEQLTLARSVAGRVLPAGSYQRMMRGTFDTMISTMTVQMLNVPLRQFAQAAGLSEAEVGQLGETTGRQVLAIVDPSFEERTQLGTKAMMNGMVDVMARMEPEMREGMAEACAARFSAAELKQIDGFFSTPSGSKFAGQQFTIMSDPAFARRMQGMMGTVTRALPDLIKRAQAATASLPKAKTMAQLTPDERARLAALLGVSPDKLNPQATEPQQ